MSITRQSHAVYGTGVSPEHHARNVRSVTSSRAASSSRDKPVLSQIWQTFAGDGGSKPRPSGFTRYP